MGGEGKISAYLRNRRFLIGLTVLLSVILVTVVFLLIRERSPFKAEEVPPTPPPEGYTYVVPGGAGSRSGTSWNSAYATLQEAINRLPSLEEGSGRVILMKQGVYNTASNITIGNNNWQNNVTIIGGFRGDENNALPQGQEPTVIDFNATQNNQRHFSISFTYNIELRNLTITRGYFSTGGGGGLRIANSNNIKVVKCRFINNRTASNSNGAAINIAASSNVIFRNNEIIGNITSAISGGFGGGIFAVGNSQNVSTGEISRNFFYDNTANGGGALALGEYTNFKIFNNVLSTNRTGSSPRSGGAIYADGFSNNSVINHNTFIENMANASDGQVIKLASQGENDSSNKLIFRYNLIKISSSYSAIDRDPLVNFIDFQGNNIQANKVFSNTDDWTYWQNLNKKNSTATIFFENESEYSNPLSFRLTGINAVGAIINNHPRNVNDPAVDYQGTLRSDGLPDNGAFEFTGQIETPTPDITPGSSPTITPPPPSPSPSPTIGGDSGGSNPGSGSRATPPSASKTQTPTKSSGSSGGSFPSNPRVTSEITPTATVVSFITPSVTRESLSLPEEGEEANLQAIIIWVIVILLLIIFGLALYLILAGKRRKRKEEQEKSQQPPLPPEKPN